MVALSLGAALVFTLQVALQALPNIETCSLLFVLFARRFGWKTFGMVAVFNLLEGVYYTFEPSWWIPYWYVWPLLVCIGILFRKQKSPLFWAPVLGAFGLIFGTLTSIPYLFMYSVPIAVARWLNGISFDLLHAAGNFAIALVLFVPLDRVFDRLGYGIMPPRKSSED